MIDSKIPAAPTASGISLSAIKAVFLIAIPITYKTGTKISNQKSQSIFSDKFESKLINGVLKSIKKSRHKIPRNRVCSDNVIG